MLMIIHLPSKVVVSFKKGKYVKFEALSGCPVSVLLLFVEISCGQNALDHIIYLNHVSEAKN